MYDFFISYAREDTERAREIAEVLRGEGAKVWIDEEDIPASIPWMAEIERSVAESLVVIALASEHWRSSVACGIELDIARRAGVEVLEISPDETLAGSVRRALEAYAAVPQWRHGALALASASAAWDDAGRAPALLVRGAQLRMYRTVLRSHPRAVSQVARRFVAAGRRRALRRLTARVVAFVVVPVLLLAISVSSVVVARVNEQTSERIVKVTRLASAYAALEWNPYAGLETVLTDVDSDFISFLYAFEATSVALPTDWREPVPAVVGTASAASPDGDRVAAVEGSLITITPVDEPELVRRFTAATPSTALAWSPDGRWIVVGGATAVEVFSATTGASFPLRGSIGEVVSVRWPDAGRVEAVTTLGTATWDAFVGASEIADVEGGIAYGAVRGDRLVAVSPLGILTTVDVETGATRTSAAAPDGASPTALDIVGSSVAVALLGDQPMVRVYDLETLEFVDHPTPGCRPFALSISPDESRAYVVCLEVTANLGWIDLVSGDFRAVRIDVALSGVEAFPDRVIWGGYTGGAWSTDLDLTAIEYEFGAGCGVPVRGFAVGPGGVLYPYGDGTGSIGCAVRADPSTGAWEVDRLILSSRDGSAAPAGAVTEDGSLLAYGMASGRVRVYLAGDFAPVLQGSFMPGQVRALGFAPDGRNIVVAGADGHVVRVPLPYTTREEGDAVLLELAEERLRAALDRGVYALIAS